MMCAKRPATCVAMKLITARRTIIQLSPKKEAQQQIDSQERKQRDRSQNDKINDGQHLYQKHAKNGTYNTASDKADIARMLMQEGFDPP